MEKSLMEPQAPVLADPAMSLTLDGAWRVRRRPFAVPEAGNAMPVGPDAVLS